MHVIRSWADFARALDSPIDPTLKRVLAQRRDQLADYTDEFAELACFIVAEPGDSVAQIETEARFPIVSEAAFEWVAEHGGWYEAPTVLSDDGYGIVLFVPDSDDIDAQLLRTVRLQDERPTAT